ncbi:hypothetical protein CYMTET_53080 [Cymbomonas tetramitiformis]|uniref:Uncharacterized protein n=1 Tax=Cymbomonas tetramitiformis TaxID=36881 RepID=A0AAE0BHN1_9CHLO|nr:hypothetical protein CYMTET_53080 [Cymbomonas tetramitiformis]|eukprot:gene4560-5581_t
MSDKSFLNWQNFEPDKSQTKTRTRVVSKPALPWMNTSTKVEVQRDRDPITGREKAGTPDEAPSRAKKQFVVATQKKPPPFATGDSAQKKSIQRPSSAPCKPVSKNFAIGTDALPKGGMTFEKTSSDYKTHSSGDAAVRATNKTLHRGSEALPQDGGMSFDRTSGDYGTSKSSFQPDIERTLNKAKNLERKHAEVDAKGPSPKLTSSACSRVANRNFVRGTQALPEGNMNLASTTQTEFKHHDNKYFVERAENKTLARSTQALPQGSMIFNATYEDYKPHSPIAHTPTRASNKTLAAGTQALPSGNMSFSRTSSDYQNHSSAGTTRAANRSLQSSIVFG